MRCLFSLIFLPVVLIFASLFSLFGGRRTFFSGQQVDTEPRRRRNSDNVSSENTRPSSFENKLRTNDIETVDYEEISSSEPEEVKYYPDDYDPAPDNTNDVQDASWVELPDDNEAE